ncbi:MAG: hypothetical protein NTV39_02835 [Candidatus Saccharibacteria bacterium]|nr:hypothetical protein [Candidatus Saccharibacteria bacterium]
MQPDSTPQNYTNIEMSSPPKSGRNWKRILLFVLVAAIAGALSGVAVWAYMNSQNESKAKELNVQITSKTTRINSLQSNVKSLETQVATKTTTATSSTQQTTSQTGIYESLLNYCKTDNKTVGFATLSNNTPNGAAQKYFGSCSVAPAGALTGGYVITAVYTNNAWQELFKAQQATPTTDAICTKNHIPYELLTCTQNN